MRNWRISTKLLKFISWFCLAISLTLLPSCVINSTPPKPFSSEVSPTDPIAEIVEIKNRPVWIKFLNSSSETSATVGTNLKIGETIRTEANARTQILFKSGVVVRIEGDSTLGLNPKNQLELTRGKLIARIAGDKNVTVQIKTPLATAAIGDSTVYIEVPKDSDKERHIFAMQGAVEVKLNSNSETINLKTGQDLRIKSDGVASSPQNLDPQAIDKRFAQSQLLYGFNTKLDSQASIEQDLKISNKVKDPDKIPFKRSEKNPKPNDTAAVNNSNSPAKVDNQAPVEPPPQPAQEEKPRNNNPPANSAPVANPPRSNPNPAPTAQAVAEPPPLPVQPETTPLEPLPVPVQPEAQPAQPSANPAPIPEPNSLPKPR